MFVLSNGLLSRCSKFWTLNTLLIYAKIQHISDSPTKHFAPILPYVRNLKSAKIQLPIKRIFVTLHPIQKSPHDNERTLSGFSRRRRWQRMPLSRLAVNWPQHRVGFSLAHPLRQPVGLPAHRTALHAERALQPRPRISPIAHRWSLRWLHHFLHFFQRSATSSPLWHALAVCLLRLRKCCTRACWSVCRTMGWRKNPSGISRRSFFSPLTPHGKFRHRRRQEMPTKKAACMKQAALH